MPIIQLQISSPSNNAVVIGSAPVAFSGSVVSGGHPPLFFTWYSSLNTPQDPAQAALNGANTQALSFAKPLGVGSHVIIFSAKDRESDAPDEVVAVQHAGMAGGPPQPGVPSPCVVHALSASLLTPAPGATLSRASATLTAVAPSKWGAPDYAPLNRVRYRWIFTPAGAPVGRQPADLVPPLASLAYAEPKNVGDPHSLSYIGPLPAALGAGLYALRLRVELFEREDDLSRTPQFHDDPAGARQVTLT